MAAQLVADETLKLRSVEKELKGVIKAIAIAGDNLRNSCKKKLLMVSPSSIRGLSLQATERQSQA